MTDFHVHDRKLTGSYFPLVACTLAEYVALSTGLVGAQTHPGLTTGGVAATAFIDAASVCEFSSNEQIIGTRLIRPFRGGLDRICAISRRRRQLLSHRRGPIALMK